MISKNYKKIAIINNSYSIESGKKVRINLNLKFKPSRVIVCLKMGNFCLSADSAQYLSTGKCCQTAYLGVKVTNLSQTGFDIEKSGVAYEGEIGYITNIIAIE